MPGPADSWLLVGTAQDSPPSCAQRSATGPWTSTAPPAGVQNTVPFWNVVNRPPAPDCSPDVGYPSGPSSQPVLSHRIRICPCTNCACVAGVQ
jgi:hypothetical protein